MPSVDFGIAIPPFVRIKSVYMRQFWPSISQHLLPLLKQFYGNFMNSLNFRLDGTIRFDNGLFGKSTCSGILFQDDLFAGQNEFMFCLCEMLEIFGQCSPQFTFCMNGRTHQQMDTLPLIASALELPSVQASNNVHFLIPINNAFFSTQLSYQNLFKAICDWLHLDRHYDNGKPPVKQTTNRSLTIGSADSFYMLFLDSIDCIEQLIDIVKVASFFT